jgi:hypothetical protein
VGTLVRPPKKIGHKRPHKKIPPTDEAFPTEKIPPSHTNKPETQNNQTKQNTPISILVPVYESTKSSEYQYPKQPSRQAVRTHKERRTTAGARTHKDQPNDDGSNSVARTNLPDDDDEKRTSLTTVQIRVPAPIYPPPILKVAICLQPLSEETKTPKRYKS